MSQTTNDPRRTLYETSVKRDQPGQFAAFLEECRSLKTDKPLGTNFRGSMWMFADSRRTDYNQAVGPNARSCSNGLAAAYGALAASSAHPGGVQCLFVDGHVSRIADTIALPVWRGTGTRAGAEVIAVE